MFKKEFVVINKKHDYVVTFTTDENYKTNKDEILISIKDFYKMMKKNFLF